MSQQPVATSAPLSLTWRVDLLLTLETLEARRARALGAVALVDLGVGITQLDGDIALQLVLETDGLHLRDGFDDGGLSVSDVTDGTNVDGRLTRDNLGREGVECGQVDGVWVRLLGQFWSLRLGSGHGALLHGRLAGLLLLGLERLLLLNLFLAIGVDHGRAGLGLLVGKIAVGSHICGGVDEKICCVWQKALTGRDRERRRRIKRRGGQ